MPYPQMAYVQALEGMMFLRHIRGLLVEIMVGHVMPFSQKPDMDMVHDTPEDALV